MHEYNSQNYLSILCSQILRLIDLIFNNLLGYIISIPSKIKTFV